MLRNQMHKYQAAAAKFPINNTIRNSETPSPIKGPFQIESDEIFFGTSPPKTNQRPCGISSISYID